MCFKTGKDEMDTVKNLMILGVTAVVADALELEMDEVSPSAHLVDELGMTPAKAAVIEKTIAEYFDGREIDLSTIATLQDLLDLVVLSEFSDTEDSPADEEFEYRMAA